MKLSIIVPCYNEQGTIKEILDKIQNLKLSVTKEIIIVDDNSNDGTEEILKNYKKIQNIKILRHLKNEGKGSAIKTAKKYVTGEIIIIKYADLEYDPKDFSKLIKPILDKEFKVVYGSRVLNQKRYNAKGFTSKLRVFGNHVLTIISNILNKQKLTDAHTCYKVFDKEVFDKIYLEEKDFAFCPEVTTKISKLGYEIVEVPINYNGRSYEEGKKIRFIDAYRALKTLIKYR